MAVLNMDYSTSSIVNRRRTNYIAYLEAELATMRKVVRDLSSPLFDPKITLGEDEHFTPMQRRLLCVLNSHKGQIVNHGPLMTLLYGFDELAAISPPDDGIIKVFVSTTRKKLKHHEIICDWGIGYALVPRIHIYHEDNKNEY